MIEPIISTLSDRLASGGYLLAFVVCMAWVGISISNAMAGRHVAFWLTLAVSLAAAGTSLLLMGIYAGWQTLPYFNILAITRIGFALAGLFGLMVTLFYLFAKWNRCRVYGDTQGENHDADYQNVD